jgi:hypothetical protein
MVMAVLSNKEIKSTNEITKELERLSGQVINWHIVYRVLAELNYEGRVEKLPTKVGFFWRRR